MKRRKVFELVMGFHLLHFPPPLPLLPLPGYIFNADPHFSRSPKAVNLASHNTGFPFLSFLSLLFSQFSFGEKPHLSECPPSLTCPHFGAGFFIGCPFLLFLFLVYIWDKRGGGFCVRHGIYLPPAVFSHSSPSASKRLSIQGFVLLERKIRRTIHSHTKR